MKKKDRWFIVILLFLVILGSTTIYCVKAKDTPKVVVVETKSKEELPKEEKYVSRILDLRKRYSNEDIISELEIPEIELNEIVTKSLDNEYYLNYDLYKNYNMYGNPYIDFRNGDDLSLERQINIYSHNIQEKTLKKNASFSKLENLLDKEIFDKTNYIYLKTEKELIKYELYAVKLISNDKEHMILDTGNDDLWQTHLDKLLKNTISCKDDCKLEKNTELLILQTCYFDPKDSYILVIGKKIK